MTTTSSAKLLSLVLLGMLSVVSALSAPLAHAQQSALQGTGSSRVAAGSYLPLTVKLTNFGSATRVDVEVTYKILSADGVTVSSETETVAVDTTASFVKQLLVPSGTPPGDYRAESDITYPGQKAPAKSSFPFTVERAFLGIFVSDLILYGGIAFALVLLSFVAGRLFIRSRARRATLFDYSDKPKSERIYYEIVSDTIGQMRQRVGDRALDIALKVHGLSLDERTGRVLALTESPAKVVADLVSGYEAALGKKVSFALRKGEK